MYDNRSGFQLDSQLAADTWPVCDLHLCRVLLARNAAWPWLILVPMRENKVELIDLTPPDQGLLWREIEKVSRLLQRIATPDKLNIAALGNVVRQLHVHVVARIQGDPGWPGPIWGSGFSAVYSPAEKDELLERLYDGLHR
jgi:diadenosine tetraphosphate (Ap4A) HIT family hydrolase